MVATRQLPQSSLSLSLEECRAQYPLLSRLDEQAYWQERAEWTAARLELEPGDDWSLHAELPGNVEDAGGTYWDDEPFGLDDINHPDYDPTRRDLDEPADDAFWTTAPDGSPLTWGDKRDFERQSLAAYDRHCWEARR